MSSKTLCYAASELKMLSAELNPTERLSKESVVSVTAASYDLCEYSDSHPGMPRQSQALRLAIKQVTNAKPVS
jgi:hypothetical protein